MFYELYVMYHYYSLFTLLGKMTNVILFSFAGKFNEISSTSFSKYFGKCKYVFVYHLFNLNIILQCILISITDSWINFVHCIERQNEWT